MTEHFLLLVALAFVLRFIFAGPANNMTHKLDKVLDNLRAIRYTVDTDAGPMTFKCHVSLSEKGLAEVVKHLNKRIAISTDEHAYAEYVREYTYPQNIRADGETLVEFSIDNELWGPVQLDGVDNFIRFRMPDGQVCQNVRFEAQENGMLRVNPVS